MLARDVDESKRLEWQHQWIKGIAHNNFIHPSISLRSVCAVADVATGTGAWIRDLAATWPATGSTKPEFFGFDISSEQYPNNNEANIQFRVHDATQPFPEEYLGRFDVVNVRLMSYAIKQQDLQIVVDNIAAILRPKRYLNWQECDMIDAWASLRTAKAQKLIATVVAERIARGLTPAIVTPLLHAISACTAPLPDGMINPKSWTGSVLRIMQLQSLSTEGHAEPIVQNTTSAVIRLTSCALLKSGAERRETAAAHAKSPEAEIELKAAQEMLDLANALEAGNDDPGTSTWNCEMTWLVAQKAVSVGIDADWMAARYGN